jgi:hypothetical protein
MKDFDAAFIQGIDQRLAPDMMREPFNFHIEWGCHKNRADLGCGIACVEHFH